MTHLTIESSEITSKLAKQRIDSFQKRFGKEHLYFAYHAALPLVLTPDLLYCLWANFQQDTHSTALEIPWIAVADLILSNLCSETGHELYEMDQEVRNELLARLKNDPNLGEERVVQLANFLIAYVRQQLFNSDPDVRDIAQVQRWVALAVKQPRACFKTRSKPDSFVRKINILKEF